MPSLFGSNITPTGTRAGYLGLTPPTGWVLACSRTIGNAASGGTERAHADTFPLFKLLWDSYADAQAPVSGGRGASAAADYAANKTIAVIDYRGRTGAGKDNMGGVAANRVTSGGSGVTGTTLGAVGGAETHALTTAQLASHDHGTGQGGESFALADGLTFTATPGAGVYGANSLASTTATSGSGTAHNNLTPTVIETIIVKL
jgi:microcystin-dependent protein